MRNTLKVAKWEIKRNMKNKSFIISLFLTPALMLFFFFMPSIFGDSDKEDTEATNVFVNDELNVFSSLQETVEQSGLNWEMQPTDLTESEIKDKIDSSENTAYIFLNDKALANGVIPVYTSEDIDSLFTSEVNVLTAPIRSLQMEQLNLSDEQLTAISKGLKFKATTADDSAVSDGKSGADQETEEDSMRRIVPGIFAGIILIMIVLTGMNIFQSASQEKKDKIAEIILSSLTPAELMQGKILGYFVLGLTQGIVLLVVALPVAIWKTDIPIFEYLLVPQTILLVAVAILGYLLFASIFVGIGATLSDITTAGNFQGMLLMLPFLPFIFIGPVLNDPSGFLAQLGSYIPFTSPGVLLLRLSMLDEWPWIEIVIALVILIVSVWLCMKLAGKIFKTGILMYGKNASPKEIWKWIRA
ncbi:ABC transporter permease [Virgibacillus ndiopensis]|uniref:ABC transporter permease n=1 Tax=Virgibacillus ndiopensis TaxID=2004408 RepID=UPI000C089EAF|nr:ABC transporter permease [Virgibacillus ndiopensis]